MWRTCATTGRCPPGRDWVLELPCKVDRAGVHPLPIAAASPVCAGLIAQVKAYELLTAEAARTGDRKVAYEALLAHPLGPPPIRYRQCWTICSKPTKRIYPCSGNRGTTI